MNCDYRCDGGWLVTDGVADFEEMGDCDGVPIPFPLLWPTEYIACICNPLHSRNDEMEAVV